MKKYLWLLVMVVLTFGCEDDKEFVADRLSESGLLGKWEKAHETRNGISDMLPVCCIFFEFLPDSNKEDQTGVYKHTDSMGHDQEGTFSVDPSQGVITFIMADNDQLTYEYALDFPEGLLTLMFNDDRTDVVQTWERIDE